MSVRYALFLLVGILLLSVIQSQIVIQRPKYFIPGEIFVIGKGIITEMENPLEFEPVRIFVGRIVVYIPGIDDWIDVDTGILKIGNRTYRLIPIKLENRTFEANLVDRPTRETVGRIYVKYVVKYWQGLWVGDLSLRNKSYYVYILEEKRVISPKPFLERIPRKLLEKIEERIGKVVNLSQKVAICIKNPKSEECEDVFEECLKKRTHFCRAFVNVYCKIVGHEDCPEEGMEREVVRRLRKRWKEKYKEEIEIPEEEEIEEEEYPPEEQINTTEEFPTNTTGNNITEPH